MIIPWRILELVLLLTLALSMAASINLCPERQRMQNISLSLTEVNTTVQAHMGAQAVLCCPRSPQANVMLTTWEIILTNKIPCRIAYRSETKETVKKNCTDERITWASSPDQSLDLQIDVVALTHEGYYKCETADSSGNYYLGFNLQVLVPPKVSLTLDKTRTAVCEAVAGKPAARISWIPEWGCVTETKLPSNDTGTVRSTCRCTNSNVTVVTCLVSHLTGNKNMSIQLLSDAQTENLYIYIIPSIILLIIMGFICFLKSSSFRKCKSEKPDTTIVVEEDEMQPYASYTERSNTLYDTANIMRIPQLARSKADHMDLPISPVTGI